VELTDEQAQDVFAKVDVGIMHPRDVLLAEGLWSYRATMDRLRASPAVREALAETARRPW
jgi:hypothetical protein